MTTNMIYKVVPYKHVKTAIVLRHKPVRNYILFHDSGRQSSVYIKDSPSTIRYVSIERFKGYSSVSMYLVAQRHNKCKLVRL